MDLGPAGDGGPRVVEVRIAVSGDAEPRIRLERWDGRWPDEDPFADLKADVAAYGHLDPLETLRGLSEASGVPVGALARYVLARWAAGGAEGLLELGASGVDHLARTVEEGERVGTDAARLAGWETVRDVVRWLRAGLEAADDPESGHADDPESGHTGGLVDGPADDVGDGPGDGSAEAPGA